MSGLQTELCECFSHQAVGVLFHVSDEFVIEAETSTSILGMCLKHWSPAALSVCGSVSKMEFLQVGD